MLNDQCPLKDQCPMTNDESSNGSSLCADVRGRSFSLGIGHWGFTGHWLIGHWVWSFRQHGQHVAYAIFYPDSLVIDHWPFRQTIGYFTTATPRQAAAQMAPWRCGIK